MSTIEFRICDKCKKQTRGVPLPREHTLLDYNQNERRIDLCEPCYQKFIQFMGDDYNLPRGAVVDWDFEIKKKRIQHATD